MMGEAVYEDFVEAGKSSDVEESEDSYKNIYMNEVRKTQATRRNEKAVISASEPRTAGCQGYILAVCLLMLLILLLPPTIILWVNYNNLTMEKDQLQTSYNNLTAERDQLQTSYNNLTAERDQLQTSYNNLTAERDQLQASYNNLTELQRDRDELEKKFSHLKNALDKIGWKYFSSSIYYISNGKKSWSVSREECRKTGADLVIINNREEQDFVEELKKNETAWIGANDRDREGTWKWVDDTAVTYRLWTPGEPNNVGDEDCAISYYNTPPNWIDVSCNREYIYICEKRTDI